MQSLTAIRHSERRISLSANTTPFGRLRVGIRFAQGDSMPYGLLGPVWSSNS